MDAAASIDVRWWARRTRDFLCVGGRASAFAHPTALSILVESKENRPLFAALGQGVALIPVFFDPLRRGDGAPQGAWPGFRQPVGRNRFIAPFRRQASVDGADPPVAG